MAGVEDRSGRVTADSDPRNFLGWLARKVAKRQPQMFRLRFASLNTTVVFELTGERTPTLPLKEISVSFPLSPARSAHVRRL